MLRFSEGLKYEEIADALECPVGTVKSRIFNGLAALRVLLGDAWQDDSQLSTLPASCKPHAV